MSILKREKDKFEIENSVVRAIQWKDNNYFDKIVGDKPVVGCSLMMGTYPLVNSWLTTEVTEIIKETDECIKFRTKNSIYELHIQK